MPRDALSLLSLPKDSPFSPSDVLVFGVLSMCHTYGDDLSLFVSFEVILCVS